MIKWVVNNSKMVGWRPPRERRWLSSVRWACLCQSVHCTDR